MASLKKMKRCDRIGHIDFLEKVDNPSRLGRHAYEVTDTKLSRKAAPKHIIQLCFYAELLEHFQGTLPEYVHLKLGDGRRESFYLQDYYAYYKIARSRHARADLADIEKYPAAHIYHYGHYEETALKNLMSEHGTREFQVDQLLRNHKLVDLYKVVRQGLRISESSYSLKKVEHFYMENRDADVVSAVESVIFYEKWKLTRDPPILDAIRDYNEEDCRSTFLLHTWLLSIKPASAACFFDQPAESVEDTPPDSAITEHEQALAQMRNALADNLPENREDWSPDDALFHLTGLLLDFYRRVDKPGWWAAQPGSLRTLETTSGLTTCLWMKPARFLWPTWLPWA